MSKYRATERIRDQVHGFVELSGDELRIVDSFPFQRLRRIRQLALTHLVYPGAEHTRFCHSIGVMHLATRVFDCLCGTSPDLKKLSAGEVSHLRQVLRLYALLHDLGHGPFSHVDVLDEQTPLFPKDTSHESFSSKIAGRAPIATIIDEMEISLLQNPRTRIYELLVNSLPNSSPGSARQGII